MIKTLRANIDAKLEATAVMTLTNPDISMDEAVERLKVAGNEIISIDGNKVTVMDTASHPIEEVWQCEYCEAYSRNYDTILQHEVEAHGRNHS